MRVFSRKTIYGLRALCHLAEQYQTGLVVISDLSERERVPLKFLESILLELNQAGLLESRKGRRGGYRLAIPPAEIKLNAVITALEGPFVPLPCTLAHRTPCEECAGDLNCPMRLVASSLKEEIDSHLSSITIEDLLIQNQTPAPAAVPKENYV